MRKLYAILCLLAFGFHLFAQEHVTIDQCQNWAVAQPPSAPTEQGDQHLSGA